MLKFFFLFFIIHVSLKAEKVLICGVCQNVANTFENTSQNIESLASFFEEVAIVIYENNSKDKTRELMSEWAHRNPQITFVSEFLSQKELPQSRTERIALARNKLLGLIKDPKYDEFEYVVMADLDFSTPWPIEEIVKTIRGGGDFDFVGANGVIEDGRYYDRYAFRNKRYPFGPEILGDFFWKELLDPKRRVFFKPSDRFIPVYSAFGGLGIYKRGSLLNVSYSGTVTADLKEYYNKIINDFSSIDHLKRYGFLKLNRKKNNKEEFFFRPNTLWESSRNYQEVTCCEHLPFHASMWKEGHGKFYVNPKMVIEYTNRFKKNGEDLKVDRFVKKVSSWQSTEFIWNLYLASSCKVGLDKIPSDYFKNEEEINFLNFKKRIKKIRPGEKVWINPLFLMTFCQKILPTVKVPIVLLISGADPSFPSDLEKKGFNVEEFLSNKQLIHVFAQNCDYKGPSKKVTPIPIGIDFHSIAFKNGSFLTKKKKSPKLQEKELKDLLLTLKPTKDRKLLAYVDFHLNDSMHGDCERYKQFGEDRASIFQQILPSRVIDYAVGPMERLKLWKIKGNYAFSVSPHGNGLDCHRTWEDLSLGCIVIVKTSPLDSLYEGLPVVIVQDWSEITEENMKKWIVQYGDAFTNPLYREKLTNEYWMKKIESVIKESVKL
jgi:hypothetical protein